MTDLSDAHLGKLLHVLAPIDIPVRNAIVKLVADVHMADLELDGEPVEGAASHHLGRFNNDLQRLAGALEDWP
jgi:hypothetical protein